MVANYARFMFVGETRRTTRRGNRRITRTADKTTKIQDEKACQAGIRREHSAQEEAPKS